MSDVNKLTGLTLSSIAIPIYLRRPTESAGEAIVYPCSGEHVYAVQAAALAALGMHYVQRSGPNTWAIHLKSGGHPKAVDDNDWVYLNHDYDPVAWDRHKSFREMYRTDAPREKLMAEGEDTLQLDDVRRVLTLAASPATSLYAKRCLLNAAGQHLAAIHKTLVDASNRKAANASIRATLTNGSRAAVIKLLKNATIEELLAAYEEEIEV